MKKFQNIQPYVFLILTIVLIVFFGIYFSDKTNSSIALEKSEYKYLNTGWYVLDDQDQVVYLDEFPILDYPNSKDEITIYHILDDDFKSQQTILIRTSLQDVIVYLDGEAIYQHLTDDSKNLPLASLWHMIDLNEDSDGKVLSITYHSPYERFNGYFNQVVYGSPGDLQSYLLDTFGYRLLIGLILFVTGLMLMIINQFVDKKHSTGRVYLAMTIMVVSVWIMMESKIVQLYVPSEVLIGSLAYTSIAAMGLPLVAYIRQQVSVKFKKIYFGMAIYFSLQFIAIIVLQATGIYSFYQTLWFVQLSLVLSILLTLLLMFIEYYKYHNNQSVKFLKHFMVVILFAAIELLNYYFSDFGFTSVYGVFIMTAYLLVMLVKYVFDIQYRYRLSYQLEVVNQLVYIDALTGGKNRYAFETDFEKDFGNQNVNHQLRLVIFDFDNFKEINDNFGHIEGDETLKTGLKIIKASFGKYGECYRLGGDEFACIMHTNDKKIYAECVQDLDIALHNAFEASTYMLEISMGSSIFASGKYEKPSDMFRHADESMYQNKRDKKSDQKE